MRFNHTFQIAPDTSWPQELPEFYRRYFEQKAGKLNHELGYQ